MKSKKYLQYLPDTPKYNTYDPYWMQNDLMFGIPFWIPNKLNILIKIFITIYLSFVVLFPYVPLYYHHEPWVHITLNIVHDNAKKGQLPIAISQRQLDF